MKTGRSGCKKKYLKIMILGNRRTNNRPCERLFSIQEGSTASSSIGKTDEDHEDVYSNNTRNV